MGLYLLCNKLLHVAGRDWDRLRSTRYWSLVNTYKRKREEAEWGRERTEIQTLTKPGATLQGTLQTLEPISIGLKCQVFIHILLLLGTNYPRNTGHSVPSWWISQWYISMSDVFLDETFSCQFSVDSWQWRGRITTPESLRRKQVGPHKGSWQFLLDMSFMSNLSWSWKAGLEPESQLPLAPLAPSSFPKQPDSNWDNRTEALGILLRES